MTIRWEGHLSQAMQRHSGSVKDGAAKSPSDGGKALPLVPEYGDPIWMPVERADNPEHETEHGAQS